MDEQRLIQALKNADAAGNREDAHKLAQALNQLRQGNEPYPVDRGQVLPFSVYSDGSKGFDSDAGILGAAKRAFMLPGQVYNGEVDLGTSEGMDRAIEMGGMVTPGGVAARAIPRSMATGKVRAPVQNKAAVPTADELANTAGKQYDEMRATGAEYDLGALNKMTGKTRTDLEQDGFHPANEPKTFRVLDDLEKVPPSELNPKIDINGLHAARKRLKRGGKDFANPSEQSASATVRQRIDDFISNNAGGSDVSPRNQNAGRLLDDANRNYAAAKRAQTISTAKTKAERQAAKSNSGQNLDNAIRQKIDSVLGSDRKSAGFSPAERAALDKVVEGSITANTARSLANSLGKGGGLGGFVSGATAFGFGNHLGGPLVGAAAAGSVYGAGRLSNMVSQASTKKALQNADLMLRKRSPLYRERVKKAGKTAAPNTREQLTTRAAIISLLNEYADQAEAAR